MDVHILILKFFKDHGMLICFIALCLNIISLLVNIQSFLKHQKVINRYCGIRVIDFELAGVFHRHFKLFLNPRKEGHQLLEYDDHGSLKFIILDGKELD